MSKLYDVISKLDDMAAAAEEDNAQALIPFPVEEKSRSPLTRILLVSGILVLLGVGCLAFVWWLKSTSLPVAQQGVAGLPTAGDQPLPAQTEAKAAPKVSSPAVVLESAVAVPSTVESAFSSSGLSDALVDVEKEGRMNDRTIKVHPAKLVGAVVEPRPLESAALIDEVEEHLTPSTIEPAAQMSRWLQQAEAFRRNGEWESAATLFTRIYQRSGSPAVANNLAATLIRLERYREARDVLVEALAKTPDDKDLQKNYQLILQLEKAGKV